MSARLRGKERRLEEFHGKSAEQTLEELKTDREGLSESEAQSRLTRYGENKLAEKKKKSMFLRFLEQFKDVMIIILIAAAIISFAVACVDGDPMEFIEPSLILLIVILNAVLGLFSALVQDCLSGGARRCRVGRSSNHWHVCPRNGIRLLAFRFRLCQ